MHELLRTAVVGTGTSTSVTTQDPALDPMLGALGLGAERTLLLGAASVALRRRAGVVAERLPAPGEPAPPESLRVCSPGHLERLTQTLVGDFGPVLPEALELLITHQRRVPHEALPLVLDKVPVPQRLAARRVLGERGRWLGQRRPEWAWAAEPTLVEALPPNAEALWSEGNLGARKELLKLARATDRGRAARWIGEVWKQESADHRQALLAVLEEHVGPDDEPFLEQILTDRSGQVRLTAARMLWRLPESALAQRLRARAEGLITVKRPTGFLSKVKAAVGGSGSLSLDVQLPPETFDPSWEKEGIVEKPVRTGRRQWWLAQTIAAVSPAHWEARFEATPAELVAAATATEFAEAILDGWTFAALQHGTRAWFEPLWRFWRGRQSAPDLTPQASIALLSGLEPSVSERLARELLSAGEMESHDLTSLPRPWPESIADAFLDAFPRRTQEKQLQPWLSALPVVALAFPPSRLDRTLPPIASGEGWHQQHNERVVETFHATLRFRHGLHEEIRR